MSLRSCFEERAQASDSKDFKEEIDPEPQVTVVMSSELVGDLRIA